MKFDLSKWNPIINIYTLTLTPGMKFSQIVNSIFSAKLPNAIIIRSYGIGNAPISSKDFYNFLELTFQKDIIVVNTTQCVSGGVNMHYYRSIFPIANSPNIALNNTITESVTSSFIGFSFLTIYLSLKKTIRKYIKAIIPPLIR